MPSQSDPTQPLDSVFDDQADLSALRGAKLADVGGPIRMRDLIPINIERASLSSAEITHHCQSDPTAAVDVRAPILDLQAAGGTPPLVTPATNARDVYAYKTRDGTWFDSPAGRGSS